MLRRRSRLDVCCFMDFEGRRVAKGKVEKEKLYPARCPAVFDSLHLNLLYENITSLRLLPSV